MKKLFQKFLAKLVKKAINNSDNKEESNSYAPEVKTLEPGFEPEQDSDKVPNVTVESKYPWWVIVLKVLAYIIGLILGGVVTTSCASHVF